MWEKKTGLNEYRRFIGYLILSFISVFIYIPVIWFISLWGAQNGFYARWAVSSSLILIFNFGFYQARLPQKWMQNLCIAAGINVILLLTEYLWLFNSL
ncbi:hypothetical protein [Desulfitobacterium sp.]|uniref:hypothetical protein n=1 Tax=Desulfitobacterium sp. TaxID=49981 RepID=UPI002BAF4351|nr:hypothetical protein [Desulfitobacterium sp.]HVJ49899.1 hypothetical protein [Desulfitobacterium sp.]